MGWLPAWVSFSAQENTAEEPDKRYVVVPPLLESDYYVREERERFAMTGYDWCTRMPLLRLLLLKHMQPGVRSTVNVAPSPDVLLFSSANLKNLTWDNLVSNPGRNSDVYLPTSTFKIRLAPSAQSRYSFASIRYNQHKGGKESPWMSACFCGPDRRWAAYAHMPLHTQMRDMVRDHAYGGLRVGSRVASAGAEFSSAGLQRLWFLSKLKLQKQGNRHLLMGAQFDLSRIGARYARPALFGRISDVATQLSSRANLFAEYSLGPPSSNTTIHIALDEGRLLNMAAFHHIARVRKVYNVFEDDDVVGVCNYLDFGIRVVAPLDDNGMDESNFEVAASWQVNSNVMVKAAACAKSITTALILKSWWNPRATVSVMTGWDLQRGHPCLGCHITIDNDDAIMPQYQRGYQGTRTGSLMREMHVATRAEVAIAGGDRIIVPDEDDSAADKENYLFLNPVSVVAESDVL